MRTGVGSSRDRQVNEKEPTPVSKRVTPSERLRAEVDEVFAGGADLASAIEQVARIGARLLLQTALEAEATAFLGRERYARAETSPQAREGSRNGYGETTIKTTSGPVTLSRPKLRGTTEAFASRLLGTGVTKTHALESLVIAGGAAGLISAVEQTMPAALRQRCLIHRARNLVAKIPKNAQAEVKADYWAIFEVPEHIEPGLEAVAYVQANIDAFATRWRDAYPAAVRVLLADRESLTHYLRTPREHWNRVRHSNFIERTFGETRRRAKVIGRLPGETSCVSLVWAVLDRASAGWRGFTQTPAGLRLLQDLRRSLLESPTPLPQRRTDPETTPQTVSAIA